MKMEFDVILIISFVQLYGFSSMFFNAIGSCSESSLVLPSLPHDNALQIEELLDKLSVSLTGEELEIIGKLYQQAMKLEVQFFSPQLVDQPVVAPLSRFNACRPASLLPPEESKSLDYNKLYEGVEVLADFEKLANSRVVDSGVLRGE